MRLTIFSTLFILCIGVFGQEAQNASYKLSDSPVYDKSIKANDDNSAVLKENYQIEFIFEEGGLSCYVLMHKKVRVFTDKGVENNNKVYIPFAEEGDLKNYEARVIMPDGKVRSLGADAVKEGVDEESNYKFKYFAFEGIEKGVDLEYFYYMRRNSMSYKGKAISLQSTSTVKYDVDFSLLAPDNLLFKSKSYNGLPDLKQDTSFSNKNVYSLHLDTLVKFHQQESAFTNCNEQYLIFKLDGNTATGKSGLYSYGSISQNIFANTHLIDDKSQKKRLEKMVKKLDLDLSSTETTVRSLENVLKTKFTYADISNPVLSDINGMLDNSAYNKFGSTRLFCAILDILEVKHEIVVTTDRTSLPFDKDFEAFNFLEEYIVYFPELGLYMSPHSPGYRLGYVSPDLMNTYGLFIKAVTVGSFTTGTGKIKWIKGLTSDKTTSSLYANVEFNEYFDTPTYHYRTESMGYYAYLQPAYDFVKEEDERNDLTKSALESIDQEGDIKDLKLKNEGGNNFGVKPLIVSGNIISDKFFEVAGTKYLFKIGEMIGPQMEMYQEEKRTLPVQLSYTKAYHREIVFNIPKGYSIANLKDLNMEIKHESEGENDMAFISTYTQEGNVVTVIVDEFYGKVDMPVQEYLAYQKVINAAADFNKIVLIYKPL